MTGKEMARIEAEIEMEEARAHLKAAYQALRNVKEDRKVRAKLSNAIRLLGQAQNELDAHAEADDLLEAFGG